MQTEDSQKVIKRFFEAIYHLKSLKVIRGKQTFTNKYGINRWNFNSLEKDMSRELFQAAWLSYLVDDFDVSAEWLLTGRGDMMSSRKKIRGEVRK